ncbi:MAG: MFS transporter [Actinobacteria bacterium]|nr:MFS transporter [Actinomycetota bacterium]
MHRRVAELLADRGVAAVVALAFFVLLGTGIVLPTLPLYAQTFGRGYGGAGVLIAAFAIARLVADVGAGVVIDRIGERRAGAFGLALLGGGSFATALSTEYWVAVAFWGLAGFGSAIFFAAQFSYLLRVVPRERMARTLSIFYGAFNIGLVLGGVLGGTIAQLLGLAAPLYLNAVVIGVAAFLYLRFVRDARARKKKGETPADAEARALRQARDTLGRLARTPGFAATLFANLAYLWMAAAVFNTLLPLFARDELGMTAAGIGVIFAITLAAEFVVLYPAGSAADRRGRRTVLIPSLAALAVMTVAVGWSTNVVMLAALMAVLGIASGVAGVPPAAMLADVVPEAESGTAVGAFRFAGDLGLALAPLVAGFSADALGFRSAFALVAIPTLVALIFIMRSEETLRPAEAVDWPR